MKKRHEQKFVILSLLLLVACNFPLLLLFDSANSFLGIPIIYAYIFLLWLIVIVVSFILIKRYHE